jgi:hypothetical protein
MLDMRDGSCALCRHDEILEIEAKTSGYRGHLSPLVAAHGTGGVFSSEPDRGAFLAYVCRKCGHTQWFAQSPADIPVGGPGIRLLKGAPPPGESYR